MVSLLLEVFLGKDKVLATVLHISFECGSSGSLLLPITLNNFTLMLIHGQFLSKLI